MNIKQVPIQHLRLAKELIAAGYHNPSAVELSKYEQVGPTIPVIAVRAGVSASGDEPVFEILAQEKTWFAAQQLGIHRVPVQEVFPVTTKQRLLFVNNPTIDNPISRAERYVAWLEAKPKRTKSALAELEGCSRSNISHCIRLLTLESEIQQHLRKGELTAGHGKELLKFPAGEGRVVIANIAVKSGWTVGQLRNNLTASDDVSAAEPVCSETLKLQEALSALIGSPVKIDSEHGVLKIDYQKDLDVLDGILSKVGYKQGF